MRQAQPTDEPRREATAHAPYDPVAEIRAEVEALRPFFYARSVAVIGASSDPMKIGGRPVAGLKETGFAGRIIPVNPNYERVQDLPAVASLDAVTEPVDLAIVAVPGPQVLDSLRACARNGVKAVTVFSAGFAEVDEAGRRDQARIVELLRDSGMRMIGPNCMGTIGIRSGLMGTFSYTVMGNWPRHGGVSIVSQSGAFGSYCLGLARDRGLGLNLWATTGNQADVDFTDCLGFAVQDEDTRVVLAYMEACSKPEALVRAFDAARRLGKPIVMMKVGTSAVGAEAAVSHTASLAGADEVYDAIFRQYDVYRAGSLHEFLSIGYACSQGRFPDTDRLGMLTISGGAGVLMADTAARCGLEVPALSAPAQAALKALAPAAGTRNPIDLTGAALHDVSLWSHALDTLMRDGDFEALTLFMAHLGTTPHFMHALQPTFAKLFNEFPGSLCVLTMLCEEDVRRDFEARGLLIYDDPVESVRAIAALCRFGHAFRKRVDLAAPPALGALSALPPGAVDEIDAKALVAEAGIPVLPERLVTSAQEAAQAAEEVGFPVAMKVVSRDIQHKSDLGGVALAIADAAAARTAYDAILERCRSAAPEARLRGVLVSPMVRGSAELILGVHRDPLFGPVVMAGLGGVMVEVFKDVTFRRAPFGVDEAHAMLRELRGFAIFSGVRGGAPADVDAAAEALARLSVFADRHRARLRSVDINPFVVFEPGAGAVALDAALVADEAAEAGPPQR